MKRTKRPSEIAETGPRRETFRDCLRCSTYRIRVAGMLDERWSSWTGGMHLRVDDRDRGNTTTELVGVLADQAALMGVLERLDSRQVRVLSVECVLAEEGEETGPGVGTAK